MKRQDYIKQHAVEYKRLCDRRDKLSDLDYTALTPRRAQQVNADLNWLCMNIAMEEERLAFALGLLLPENARKEYRPSSFHRYDGIGNELSKTKFE